MMYMVSPCSRMAGIFAALLIAGPLAAEPELSQEGREMFELVCAACHGRDGRGRDSTAMKDGEFKRRRDLTAPRIQKRADGELIALLTKGLRKFPGFRGEQEVSTSTVHGIVDYLRYLAARPPDWKPPGVEEGKRGEAIYMKACGACHGKTGKGIFKKAPPPPVEEGVVDLRGERDVDASRKAQRTPIMVIEVDEDDMSEAEMEDLKMRLRKMERKRHGFHIDQELSDEDVKALSRYLGDLERRQSPFH